MNGKQQHQNSKYIKKTYKYQYNVQWLYTTAFTT